jgi:hypothetical protein
MKFSQQKEQTDDQLLYKASSLLGISELQLFSDAWQAWYDEEPTEKRIEPYLIEFIDHNLVPFWVRNHVRKILSNKELLAREKKLLITGTITYYGPLIILFVLLIWYLLND